MSHIQPAGSAQTKPLSGIVIAGTGSAVPPRVLTNADLEKMMDTSDEWIVQRTGIRERHLHDRDAGESTASLAAEASRRALDAAGLTVADVDFIICGTMTPNMPTPPTAAVVAARLGVGLIPAFDISAGCSGFLYTINVAHAFMSTGPYRNCLAIGADCLTQHCEYTTFGRGESILFGDAAGACLFRKTDDLSKGIITQAMHTDGSRAHLLYVPSTKADFYDKSEIDERKINRVMMHGPGVFKFAVSTFPKLIAQTLDQAGLNPEDVDHYICHQSNARILAAARDRFGLPEEKFYINIDRFGNTVAASIPLALDELTRDGAVRPGQKVMFLSFGAGLSWASSLWQL